MISAIQSGIAALLLPWRGVRWNTGECNLPPQTLQERWFFFRNRHFLGHLDIDLSILDYILACGSRGSCKASEGWKSTCWRACVASRSCHWTAKWGGCPPPGASPTQPPDTVEHGHRGESLEEILWRCTSWDQSRSLHSWRCPSTGSDLLSLHPRSPSIKVP